MDGEERFDIVMEPHRAIRIRGCHARRLPEPDRGCEGKE